MWGLMGKAIGLRRAGADDIPFIMRTERLEGYSDMVGCWDEDRHRAAFADPHCAYFVAGTSERLVGFALLTGWDAADRVTLIKRVAVTEPGKGYGKELVRAVADAAFSATGVWRLWIDCFTHNTRARRAYEAVGFLAEGIARGGAFFRGENRDVLILAQLRPDWEARRIALPS